MSKHALMDHQECWEVEYPKDREDGSTLNKGIVPPRRNFSRPHLRLVGGKDVQKTREKEFYIDDSDDFASMTGDETRTFQRFLDQLNKKLNEAYEDFIVEDLPYFKGEEKERKKIQFQNSLEETQRILITISETFPLPEMVPLGSGGIEFEWFGERGYRFGIRVKGENKVIYSGLFGSKVSIHGTEEISEQLFSFLEFNLSRLFK